MASNLSNELHCGGDDVEDTEGGDRGEETGDVHVSGTPEMLLREEELISLVNNQIGLEGHVEGNEDSEVSKGSNIAQLEGTDPLQNSGVLVNDLALLKVEGGAWELGGHLHEWLVEICGVVDVLLQLEQAIDGGAKELRVSEPVCHVFVLLLGLDSDIVLIALTVVIVAGNGAVEALLLPLHDVFELGFFVPGSVSDEAVLVLEGPTDLLGHFPAGEAEIGQVGSGRPVGVKIGVNAGDSSLVRAVQIRNGVPNLALESEIVLELIDDAVVLGDFDAVMVLIQFGFDVFVGVGVLVREGRKGFIVDEDVLLEKLGIGLFLGSVEQAERVVLVGTEAGHC